MKTPIHLNGKGNEIITCYSLSVGSCIFLNNHHHCMCYCCQCSLHHICANQVTNDNIHQGSEVVSGEKDIHSLLGVAREKVGYFLLNMCSTFQSNNYDNILNYIMGYCTFTFIRAPMQMGTKTQRMGRNSK
jgi:hypothetical protein